MKKFAILCLSVTLLSFSSFAVVRTTASSGDWNNNSTWGGTIPLAGDDVVISSAHTVTININPNSIVNVTVNGILRWDATGTARTWTVTGSFTVSGTGSFSCITPGTATTHAFNYNGASFTNNGTVNLVNGTNKCNMVIGGSVTQTIGGTNTLNLNKLTLNNTGGKFVIDYGDGIFTPSETAPTKLNVGVTTADTMVIKQGLLVGCATNNATISHSFANFKMGSGTAKITSSVNVFTSIVTLTVNTALILNDATNSNVSMTVNGSFTSPAMSQSNAASAFGVMGPNCFGGAGNATTVTINGDWLMTDIFVFVGNTKVFGGTEPNNPVINLSGNVDWASTETHTIDLPFTSDDFYVQTTFFGLFDAQGAFPQFNLNGGSVIAPKTLNVAFDVYDGEVQSSSPLGSETLAQISESMSNWTVNGHWKILNGSSLAVHSDNTLTINGSLRIANGGEVAGSETESEDLGYVPTVGPTIVMGGSGVIYVENSSGLGKGLLTEAAAAVAFKNRTSDIDWNLGGISSSGTVEYAVAGAQVITDRTYNNLSTSNSGAKTMANAISVNGTLTIGAGTSLANGGFNCTASGAIVNNATHTGSGKIILGGSTNQSLSGTGSDWGNLQLNNSAGATCSNNVNTSGTINFDAGLLTTSSGAKLTFTTAGNYTGGSSSSFVNGPVSKTVNSTTEFVFPTGKNATYRQVAIQPAAATGSTFTAEYFDAPYVNTTTMDAPLISVSTIEYWQVDRSGGAVDAAIRLYWGASSGFADTLGLRIARWGGTKWAEVVKAASTGDATSGNIQSINTSSFNKPFTFGRVAVPSDNTISTDALAGSTFCPEVPLNVPFTSVGTFNGGNVYSAELSDETGDFTSPTSIGTLASAANSGNISATLPESAIAGTAYRVRVVSSDPVVTGTDNGSNFEVQACPKPTGVGSGSVTASSANISWNTMSCAAKYKVQYRIVGNPTWTKVNATTTSKTINSLLASTQYEYKVQTFCTTSGSTKSKFTGVKTFTTLAAKEGLTSTTVNGTFRMYPNPATKQVTIEVASTLTTSATLRVSNVVGQSSIALQLQLSEGINFVELPINELPAGVYLVEVKVGGNVFTQKLVKE